MTDTVAVIDIGSNSVRIRVSRGEKVLYRETVTTQLSKDIQNGMLCYKSINRTLDGLSHLFSITKEYNAQTFAFATAAVRNSKNGGEFVALVKEKFGVTIDVVSGDEESELGIIGALGSSDGIVLDVGGASSEIAVRLNGKIVYKYSLALGAVTLTDACGKNYERSSALISDKIKEYGAVPNSGTLYLIGGTATSLAFMLYGDEKYDREKNHGRIIYAEKLEEITRELFRLTPQEIVEKYHVQKKRADIIHSGSALISAIMKYLKKDSAIVSENDNLEGYLAFKVKRDF